MAEDFAVLDFALVAAAPRAVALALAEAGAGAQATARARAGARPPGGLFGRLLGASAPPPAPPSAPLLVQPAGTLPGGALAREMIDDMGFGGTDREARVSAPVGPAGLTLVELRDRTDDAPAPRLLALSHALGDVDLLAFRLSGGRHPGGEFAFTVYRKGLVSRRLHMCRASAADDWTASQTGPPHPLEAQAPPESGRPGALIPPGRQAALLAALGIDADRLLADRSPHSDVLELSTRPGGTPPADLPADRSAAGPRAVSGPDEGPSWEDEVTRLLVNAVTDALPDDEQVPWLDAMTGDLEAGRTDAALQRARDLLARGQRPEPVRTAEAARLARLFGPAD